MPRFGEKTTEVPKEPQDSGLSEFNPVEKKDINSPLPIYDDIKEVEAVADHVTVESHATLSMDASGMPWVVDYYSQMLGRDEIANPYSLTTSVVMQQYTKIQDLKIALQGQVSNNHNQESGVFEVTGTAISPQHTVIENGDVFAADMLNGMTGLFGVHDVKRLSMAKETRYEFSFNLITYVTDEVEHDLEQKTQLTLHYVEDNTLSGNNPYLTTDELNLKLRVNDSLAELRHNYLRRFYDSSMGSLVLKTEAGKFYDENIVNFWERTVAMVPETAGFPIRVIETGFSANQDSVIDEIYKGKAFKFKPKNYQTKVNYCISRNLRHTSLSYSMSYLSIDVFALSDKGMAEVTSVSSGTKASAIETQSGELISTQSFHPVNHEGNYIFSRAFYDGIDSQLSSMEILTRNYLSGKPVDVRLINRLLTDVGSLSDMDLYYYVPLLMCMLRTVKCV